MFILSSPLLEYRLHHGSCSSTSGLEKWIFTHKKIDDFITGLNLGYNMGRLRETFVKHALLGYMKGVGENFDLGYIKDLRLRLKNDLNWTISDKTLNDAIAVDYLGESITAVAKGHLSFGEYLKRQRRLGQKGFPVPLERQVKWFLKYVVARKYQKN
jgi:hypothetical protein